MLTAIFPVSISPHTLDLVGSLALHRGSQGWTHCRIPCTHWQITSGMGMQSGPPSRNQFPPVGTGGVIGMQPLSGSHIPELVRSLVQRPGDDPPPGHQTEVHDPLVTATCVPSATTGGDNTLLRVHQWQWVGGTAA